MDGWDEVIERDYIEADHGFIDGLGEA